MKKCNINTCDRKHYGKGYCHTHYMRLIRAGKVSEDILIDNTKLSLVERFKKKMSEADDNGCILFIGAKDKRNGYGKFCMGSRSDGSKNAKGAHRISYELFIGEIPNDSCVLHKCDVPLCVNPEHLVLGTQADNMKDMINKNRDRKVISFGSKHGNAKLNEVQVREIKIKLLEGIRVTDLGKQYNVKKENISSIKNGKTWKHIII